MYTVFKIAFLGYKSHVFFWVQNIRLRWSPPVMVIPEYPPWENMLNRVASYVGLVQTDVRK